MGWILGIAALLVVDIGTKWLATNYLKDMVSIHLIPGVFHLTYTENRGAAFGIMQNMQWLLILITTIVLIAIVWYWIKENPTNKWLKTSLMFVIVGAVGNYIDRIFYGFVVDFLHFVLIDFPVFNMADVFVVTGVIMLAIYILFIDKGMQKNNSKDII